mmetsp:Transcript_16015/g.24903  ORF Transcript_16015/g.24903 Transcript_16015/m.24903 type:complete len:154 (+) Transcript_16015:260-721(+)|eukprot:CAMPEP_0184312218 /NCGR_PEP_ID=MMETSP1049-20130417/48005_1 /TAXON_ID=77928 /ORGANISM="Proteomonas sulcata, Strain CCMP704" /LENGTH=153 /DNA_ID=CAMNT_0026628183 /DNA_START=240 /DNA_END=701 /DNA_ORIENTATION=+
MKLTQLKKVIKALKPWGWKKTNKAKDGVNRPNEHGMNTTSSTRDRLDTDNLSDLSTEDLDFIYAANVDAWHGQPLGRTPAIPDCAETQVFGKPMCRQAARKETWTPPAEEDESGRSKRGRKFWSRRKLNNESANKDQAVKPGDCFTLFLLCFA